MKPYLKYLLFTLVVFSIHHSIAQTPTWTDITPVGWSGNFLKAAVSKGGRVLAGVDNGWIYQSTDTGKTWQPIYNGFPNKKGYYSNNGLYDSLITNVTIGFSPDSLHGIYIGKQYPKFKNGIVVAYTADGGASWQNTQTDFSNCYLSGLCWKTKDSAFVSVYNEITYETYIYLTTNRGKSWQQTSGMLTLSTYKYSWTGDYQLYFANSKHGYAFTTGYYGETTDGGNTWTRVDLPKMQTNAKLQFSNGQVLINTDSIVNLTFPACRFSNITISGHYQEITQYADLGNGKVFGVGSITEGAGNYDIVFSSDSGRTWTNQVFKTYINGIVFLNANVGIAVSDHLNSFVTNDGGSTWTNYVYGAEKGFGTLFCKTKDECFMTSGSGLWHTTDGFTTWNYQKLTFTGSLHLITFSTPDTGYVSGSGFIFRTIDGGQNWTKFNNYADGRYMNFPTKDTGYIGTDYSWGEGDVYKTVDAGQTWTDMSDMTYVNNYGQGSGYFRSSTEGLIAGTNSLLYTNDGANTWQNKAVGFGASAIYAVNDNWIVTSGNKIYLCDKEINCTLKYSDNTGFYSDLLNPDSSTLFILSKNDSSIISKDGGNTWQKEYYPNHGGTLTFADARTVYQINGYSIYKGIIKAQTTSSQFTKVDNQTISCTITNDAKENYNASVLLVTSTSDTITVSQNIAITNGVPVSIILPNTLQTGTTYKIVIQPTDTAAFSSVQSQTFTLTGVGIVENERQLLIKVVGNTIICNCQTPFETYNTLGQRMQNNGELPTGIYIVKCGNTTQKVVIKP